MTIDFKIVRDAGGTKLVSLQTNYSHDQLKSPSEGQILPTGGEAFVLDARNVTRQIGIPQYTYSFSSKLQNLLVPSRNAVKTGHVEVDSVEQLLLGVTDTMAQGQFKWHVHLNDVGQAVTHQSDLAGTGSAEFRKQPDGDWVVSDVAWR
jgi:hypothetical protein